MTALKRWTTRRSDPSVQRHLERTAHVSPLIAALLAARGICTPDAAEKFFQHPKKDLKGIREPELLPGCKEVAGILWKAVQNRKKIVIYGDYDADGITGIVILFQALKALGSNVKYYIPHRIDEGYGLNSEAVEKLAKDGTELIITVDCGIRSVNEAETAKKCGIQLLITDHHTPEPVLPDAAAIAHPALVRFNGKLAAPSTLSPEQLEQAEKYPCPFLCGAAVALKTAWAVGQLANDGFGKPVSAPFRELLKELLGLTAMATIADFVPLLEENRSLVRGGLPFLLHTGSSGLKDLFAAAKFGEKKTSLTTEFVAFQLVPRINAAGRLGQAEFAVELLTSPDAERTKTLAGELDRLNEQRKSTERQILHEAEQMIREKCNSDDPAFVLASDWHRGVIGIAAGRLADKFHRPVILFGTDKMGLSPAVGSARSVAGFDLYTALLDCREHLIRFGGHPAAAGVTAETKQIDAFRKAFCEAVARRIPPEERVAELIIDGFFPLSAFTPQTVGQILQLAPFGSENPSPVFAAEQVTVKNAKTMGKEGTHFTAEFQQGRTSFRGVAFHRSEWTESMQPFHTPLDIAFRAKKNDYNGNVELEILDWRR
ncbi:MAG: single-stranded-DNA-specific exonuclease RecJ [Planctomycetaceae bacterium]|nr:single-stranded-DNA-specific exonuclease RecJ [Planctomycetaceae bacterium]